MPSGTSSGHVQSARNSAFPKAGAFLAAVLIVLVTLAAYVPAIRAGFIWDDDTFLTDNPLIKARDGLYRLWFTTEPPDYFPLTSTTLWLEWRLWGMNASGYHLVNVLLHAISSILLWRVLRRLAIPGAFLAGLIFAVHPVAVESVAWITERKNTLPMVFYLLCILLFVRFQQEGKRRWYALSLLSFLLALLAKTSVVMAPVVLLGCVAWIHGRVSKRQFFACVPFFVLAGVLALTTVWFQYTRAIGNDLVRTDGFLSRLAGAGWAVWFYLGKALLPYPLCFVYPRWQIDPSQWWAYLPLVALVGCMAVFWLRRTGWGRPWLFAMGYFIVTLLPVLGFFNIYFMAYSLVADHWQYTSIIGVIALVVGLTTYGWRRISAPAWCGVALAAAVVGLLGVLTWRQASIYRDSETLWNDTLSKNPQCPMAHNNLGVVFERRRDLPQAKRHYQEALRLQPSLANANNNLGSLLADQGLLDQAITHYREALRVKPNYVDAHNNYGVALGKQGKTTEAIGQYVEALRIQPDHIEARYNLAVALAQVGPAQQAIAAYEDILRRDPGHYRSHNNLAMLLIARGNVGQAMVHLETAIRLKPDSPESYNNLAWLLATHPDATWRNGPKAVTLAQKACERSGYRSADSLDTLAAALAETGRFDEAAAMVEKAVALTNPIAPAGLIDAMKSRLEAYRARQPFRDTPR